MIKAVLLIVAIHLAILGLAELIHGIWLILITPRRAVKSFAVIWLVDGYAEQQLRFAAEQARWLGYNYAENVIAVNSDLSEENFRNCKYIAERNNILFCPAEDLEEMITILSK